MDPPLELDEIPYLVGRACCLGDDVGSAKILSANSGDGHPGGHADLQAIHPELAGRLARGDFIVAGLAFGAGEATNASARALKLASVGAVIARSFGAEFFRAAVHVGLPALEVEETGAIKNGDRLRVDIEGHKVVNLSSGDRYVIRNIYGETLDVLRAGGIAEYLAVRGSSRGVG
jgi:3-isopropylmalate/(R)-2-methylmalate dehydratase small subunit